MEVKSGTSVFLDGVQRKVDDFRTVVPAEVREGLRCQCGRLISLDLDTSGSLPYFVGVCCGREVQARIKQMYVFSLFPIE